MVLLKGPRYSVSYGLEEPWSNGGSFQVTLGGIRLQPWLHNPHHSIMLPFKATRVAYFSLDGKSILLFFERLGKFFDSYADDVYHHTVPQGSKNRKRPV